MADIKNFSMAGVASSVQFGKRGAQLKQASDAFSFRTVDDAAFALVKVAFPTTDDHAATKKYVDDKISNDVGNAVGEINTARIQDTKLTPVAFVGTAEGGANAGKVIVAASNGTVATTVAAFQTGATSNSSFVFDTSSVDSVALTATGTSNNVNIHISPKGEGIVEIGTSGAAAMMQADNGQSLTLAAGDNAATIGADLILRSGTGTTASGLVRVKNGAGLDLVTFEGPTTATNNVAFVNGTSAVTMSTVGDSADIDVVIVPKGTGVVDVSTTRIANVVDPVAAQDAATKSYTDAAVKTSKVGSLQTREFTIGDSNANIGAPITGRVRRVMLHITTAYTAGTAINIGYTANPGALVSDSEIDESAVGIYDMNAVDMVLTNQQLIAFVTGAFGLAGAGKVIVEYIQG